MATASLLQTVDLEKVSYQVNDNLILFVQFSFL